MNEHEHFEELAAAAAAGVASAEEFRELEDHLEGCQECRDRVRDFLAVGAGILAGGENRHRPPAGMRARFIARAAQEGIPLRHPSGLLPASVSRHPLAWSGVMSGAVAAAVLLALLGFGGALKLRNPAQTTHRATAANQATAQPDPAKPVLVAAPDRMADDGETQKLQSELAVAKTDQQHLTAEIADLDKQLQSKDASQSGLAAQVAQLQSQLDLLMQQSVAKDGEIASLNSQLETRNKYNADELASSAEAQLELGTLRQELAERDATIENQKQLLAAGSQARDLIIARNLHIIDVHDNKGDGERQQAFGRIFYTEGKQIVFYAYDLDSAAKLKQQVAFYVWGGKLGDEKAVKNLGIFHNEDVAAGRWVLTFDDPHVLAQINTVFVTAESRKNVERPDGKQILFAYLGAKPNHP
jgi:anti-sigma factor RsiW